MASVYFYYDALELGVKYLSSRPYFSVADQKKYKKN